MQKIDLFSFFCFGVEFVSAQERGYIDNESAEKRARLKLALFGFVFLGPEGGFIFIILL